MSLRPPVPGDPQGMYLPPLPPVGGYRHCSSHGSAALEQSELHPSHPLASIATTTVPVFAAAMSARRTAAPIRPE